MVDEIERAVEDAIGVVAATVEDGKVVAGGGAAEISIARGLKEYADTISGREQLAVTAFAEALEVVPKTLAENAGLDSIDSLVDLRAAHEKSLYMGLNVFTGEVTRHVQSRSNRTTPGKKTGYPVSSRSRRNDPKDRRCHCIHWCR